MGASPSRLSAFGCQSAGAANRRGEGGEGEPEVAGGPFQIGGESVPQRARLPLHSPCPQEKPRQVLVAIDAMLPAGETSEYIVLVVRHAGDIGTESQKCVFELGPQRLDVAKGHRRGDEADELAVLRSRIPMQNGHRIEREPRRHIAALPHAFESARYLALAVALGAGAAPDDLWLPAAHVPHHSSSKARAVRRSSLPRRKSVK